MPNMTMPYLCFGTFMTQLLRFVNATTTANDRASGKSDAKSERLIYKGLITVYHMDKVFLPESTLKTYASDVKACKKSRPEFADFTNFDLRRDFESDITSKAPSSLLWMQDFVANYLTVKKAVQKERIVKIMLNMIKNDPYMEPTQKLFILGNGKSIYKKDLVSLEKIQIEALLLGIWHYIIINRYDKNESGADTIAAMGHESYNKWIEEYPLPENTEIVLLGPSGISSDTGDDNISSDGDEVIGAENDPDASSKTANDDDIKSPGTSEKPFVFQHVEKQVVQNATTINNITGPIDTLNI